MHPKSNSKLDVFCAKNAARILTHAGIEFSVEEPANPHEEIGDKNYADNFLSVSAETLNKLER